MNAKIHSSAIVSPKAVLGSAVEVAPFAIIEDNVVIDDGCIIGSRSLIGSGARLGKGVKVFNGAVVGSIPQDLKFAGEKTTLVVGENTVIREFATLNRGTTDRWETRVGSNCLLMAYSHVAHDCLIGDNVILANSVNLAGHVQIDDYAIIGGIVPVHQFVRIGAHAIIGGGFRVPMDICPFAYCGGYPLKVLGPNLVGLRRRDFSKESINLIQKAFRLLFRSKLNTTQAVEKIKSDVELSSEVRSILKFIESSERGVCK